MSATYTINRLLRIYPALWVCFGVGLLSVFTCYKINTSGPDFAIWTTLQLTIGQFYNPDFLRGYGIGTLNGSLWTIPVELQFYALSPFIYVTLRRVSLKSENKALTCLIIFMVAVNQTNIYAIAPGDTIYSKLFSVTVLPYLYMFLAGVLIQKNFQRLKPVFAEKSGNGSGFF